MMEDVLKVKRLANAAILPKRPKKGDAGYDLFAQEEVILTAHKQTAIKTGLSMTIPKNCYGRIAPRSGLALNHQIDTMAGVIDQSFGGEIIVLLFNHSDYDVYIEPGKAIAQLILERIETPEVVEVYELDKTERGESGFGSTDKKQKIK